MRAQTLPSFHDAYLRVLESVQLLKDVHGAQGQTSEPPPIVLLEAGDESKHHGEGRRLVSISHVVADLGAQGSQIESGSDGDGVQDNTLNKEKSFQGEDYIRRVEPEEDEANRHHDAEGATMREEEHGQNEVDFLLDPSRINDDTKSKETASQTGNSRRQSSGVELSDECCKGEYLGAIRKLKNPIPEDVTPKKNRNYFGTQVDDVVQDSYEVLHHRSDALKDAIAREHSENQRLKLENFFLQHKIDNLLSTVQQLSGSCDHCRLIYENNIITMEVPVAPNKTRKVVGVPPLIGQDGAVEVTENRDSNAERMVFGFERAKKGNERLSKSNIPTEPTFEDGLALPIIVADTGPGEAALKRKRGPDVSEALEGDRAVTGKTKRLSDVEKELLDSQGVISQTKPQSFTRRVNNSEEFLKQCRNVLKHGERSQGYSEGEGQSVKGPERQDDVKPGLVQLEDFEELEDPGIEHAKKEESEVNISSEEIETETDCSSRGLPRGGFEAAEQRHSTEARADSSREDLLSNGQAGGFEEKQRKQEGDRERSSANKYKDFKCGVTNKIGADTYGILRVNQSGKIQVFCRCDVDGCSRDTPMAPGAFEKHGGRAASKKWRETIWILQNNYRLPISRVKELDEYLHTPQRKRESLLHGMRTKRGRFDKCRKEVERVAPVLGGCDHCVFKWS